MILWTVKSYFLSQKTKTNLYKAIVRPILEHPPIPTNAVSKTVKGKFAVIQNKAIKFISGHSWRRDGYYNAQRGHQITNLQSLNTRLQDRAIKIWRKWEDSEHPIMVAIRTLDDQFIRENMRFPSSRRNLINREVDIFRRQ